MHDEGDGRAEVFPRQVVGSVRCARAPAQKVGAIHNPEKCGPERFLDHAAEVAHLEADGSWQYESPYKEEGVRGVCGTAMAYASMAHQRAKQTMREK